MPKKILIVDDDADLLHFAQFRIRQQGHEVYLARDGEAALHQAAAVKPDLIVLDVKLPKMNGYEVYARLKEDVSLKTIPVIFATADASLKLPEFSGKHKTDYIIKPYETSELNVKIKAFLG